jgi:hypothetical protein
MVGLENMQCKSWPLRLSPSQVLKLDKELVNCSLSLNNAVHMGIVWGYMDIMDVIPIREPVQQSDIRCTIVRDDFLDGTPSA